MKFKALLAAVASHLLVLDQSQGVLTIQSTATPNFYPSGLILYGGDQYQSPQSPYFQAPVQLATELLVDTDSHRARLSGSFAGATASTSYTTSTTTQIVGYTADSPPQPIFADGYTSVAMTMTLDPSTFATNFERLRWNGSALAYDSDELHDYFGSVGGHIAMTLAVTSNGQTTTNSYWIQIWASISASIEFNPFEDPNTASSSIHLVPGTLLSEGIKMSVTAPNGFSASYLLVPEPSSSLLLAAGAMGLLIRRKRRA